MGCCHFEPKSFVTCSIQLQISRVKETCRSLENWVTSIQDHNHTESYSRHLSPADPVDQVTMYLKQWKISEDLDVFGIKSQGLGVNKKTEVPMFPTKNMRVAESQIQMWCCLIQANHLWIPSISQETTKLQSCKWCTDFAPRHCGSTWRPARGLFQTRLNNDEGFNHKKNKKTKTFRANLLTTSGNIYQLNRRNPNANSIRCHRHPNHPGCLVVLPVLAIQEAKDLCSVVHCCGSLNFLLLSVGQRKKDVLFGFAVCLPCKNFRDHLTSSIGFFQKELWRKD